MDSMKTGGLIRSLRKEKNMTQLQLAEKLHVSDKTVSKWERGTGYPEVSLMAELSRIFEVDMQSLFSGDLNRKGRQNGNMRNMCFYICSDCGNVSVSVAETSVFCCGRKLKAVKPQKADETEKMSVEIIENDFFISSDHEMTREHYITFAALVTADTILLKKLYPEWNLQMRMPFFARGRLYWYCNQHGLFYQVM